MFRAFIVFVAALAFAGRAMALNFTFAGLTGNVTTTQLLQVPAGPWLDNCASTCSAVNNTITSCGDTDDACVCTSDVGMQLMMCEQCMFNTLVSLNVKQPDPRVGTNVGLSAFQAQCEASLANATLPALALTIAPDWDGPTDIILNTPATVIVVGFGAILGGSALYMFSTI